MSDEALRIEDGENLAHLVDKTPGETPANSLWIVRELAQLLAAGHRAGHRHLALRPTQVLIRTSHESERGIAVHLVGLGVAEALGLQRPTGVPAQHKIYLAPEQDEADKTTKIDERADVYGLGVLLLHLLLGQPPSAEQVQRCRGGASGLLASRVVRDDTTQLIQRMLALDPRQRPDMTEVVSALGVESQAALFGATLAPPAADADAAQGPVTPPAVVSANRKTVPIAESSHQHRGLTYGNFRIIRRIGQGGMGVVYEAEHQQIGRRAAVKLLHARYAQSADYASRFLNEARAVNIIRHPGLVEIFEYGQQPDGTLYIVMEYLQGESLRARLDTRKAPFPVAQLVTWALQIARALQATHAKGITHRDLKPENIMIVPDPLHAGQDWVKILDFGIAKLEPSAHEHPAEESASTSDAAARSETAAGAIIGTPIYMAPEQHKGAEGVDGRADVFSFGVMLYELVAGKLPYEDSALNLRTTPAAPLMSVRANTPKELATLVQQMLALAPAERPTMAEVEARLSALASSETKKRRTMPLILAGCVLSVLLGLGGLLAHRMLRSPSLGEARERALILVKGSLRADALSEELQATQALGKSRDAEYRPLLEPLLAETRPGLAAAAARGLGEMSAIESQKPLLELLERTQDGTLRLEVAAALARLSHPQGVDTLRALLREGNDLIRVEAALRLLEYGDRTGAPLLHKATERADATDARVVAVLVALARVGDTQARQRLAQLFQSTLAAGQVDPVVALSLARLGDAAANRQLTQLAGQAGPDQVMAARLLASLGQPDGYPALLKFGGDGRAAERLRELAVDGLGDSGQTEAAAMLARILAEAFASKRLQLAAAGSILQLAAGARAAYANRSLSWARAALGSDSGSTRELAVMLLGDLQSEEAVPALRQALKDKEREVRSGAARALGRYSVRSALEALADALDDSETDVRAAGMRAMGQVVAALRKRGERDFESAVIARLQHMLARGSAVDRMVAAGTLLRMGDSSQRDRLRDGLRDPDPLVRRLSVELTEAEPALLVEVLKDADRLVRFTAARRLAALGSRDGVAVLRSILGEGGLEALQAYSLLKKLGEEAAPPSDLTSLFSGRRLHDKEAVLELLGELPVPLALELLLTAASDGSNMIRRRAAELAYELYTRTLQSTFRSLILELRNDADVIVRARAVELGAKLPPAVAMPSAPAGAKPQSGPAPAPVDAAALPSSAPVPPVPSRDAKPAAPRPQTPGKPRSKGPGKSALPATAPASTAKEDPRAKTMGLIQIYVLKNGKCQRVNQYYLPPGDHIINVDGGTSQTVSVYAGTVIPVRQCP